MTNITILYRDAVRYAADHIKNGTDYQQIEWNLLNIERFQPLIKCYDVEDLYDEISEIISEADDEVQDERWRNAERAAEYEQQYPELYNVMDWER